jgi:hypothetical protein
VLSKSPEVTRVHDTQNFLVTVGTPEELVARQNREDEIWTPLIKKLGLKAQ